MSAFFIWIELSEKAIDADIAKSMLDDIKGYGGDSQELLLNDNLAIGAQVRWATPEDVGEKQPIFNDAETECFLFNGRIDNRSHLIEELSADSKLTDAQLMQLFLSRFGTARLAEVKGPFVFVLFNLQSGQLVCARDAMGGRYLVYRHTKDRLIISSSEKAFMSHPDVGHKMNEAKLSGWLIFHSEYKHLTCLQGLSALNPGSMLKWSAKAKSEPKVKTFYRSNPSRRIRLDSDQEYANEFRRLLDQAVARRMRCRGKVGSMLSGGMDSVPVTVSAAAIDKELIAYSWVFDESPEMDERQYSSPMCEKLGIKQRLIKCDSIWPALDETTHCNPLFPFALHYSEFNQHTFARANADGVQVMLTGMHGDLLYEASNKQVVHALKFEGVRAAINEFFDLKARLKLTLWAALKRYILAPIKVVQRWIDGRRLKQVIESDVLVPEKLKLLTKGKHWLYDDSLTALRPSQYRIVLDGFAGEDGMLGRHMENKFSIERRSPFRDRDLCEFMLAIPTSQLEKMGVHRPIVKLSYRVEFTQLLTQRNDKTRFLDSLHLGLKNNDNWQKQLASSPQFWQNYVKECDFCSYDEKNDVKAVVKWQSAYYNFWNKVWYVSD